MENLSSTTENSTTNTNSTPQEKQQQENITNEECTQQVQKDSITQVGNQAKPPLPKSKKTGKRKSWVWDHFEKIATNNSSDQRASCKYCKKSLACPSFSGTSCLSNHLSRCKSYPANVESKSQRTLTFQPLSSGTVGTTNKLLHWNFDQEECRRCLARMIICDEIPFKFVEHEGFRDFCRAMQPLFVMPSRFTVARDCYDLYKQEKLNLMNCLKKLSSRICLTADAWTSIQNLSYMCITCHFIDENWTLHKKMISFCPISSHSGEVMGQSIEKCLLDWGSRRVFTVTVDNAASNDLGIQYLKRRLNSWGDSVLNGEYLHMRCAAHILSLIVKEGLKEIGSSIDKIRNAVKYVRSSPSRLSKFKDCAKKELLDTSSLVCLDVETRWNSTYLMLKSAIKFEKAFNLLELTDKKYVTDLLNKSGLPDYSDWEYARSLLPFLEVFYETTVSLSGSLYVTGNEYMRQIYGIGLLISSWCESDHLGLRGMALKMKNKFDKYWANVDNVNIMLFVAVVLDPRFKLESVDVIIDHCYGIENGEKLKCNLRRVLSGMYDSYGVSIVPSTQVEANETVEVEKNEVKTRATTDIIRAVLKKQKISQSSMDVKTEFDRYYNEVLEEDKENFDILNWWKVNSSKYRILSAMARDVLAMPVSTVASESAFSTGGRILDSFRSSLTPRIVEALVCGQDWFRSSSKPIFIEEVLEELESLEIESTCDVRDHNVIQVDD